MPPQFFIDFVNALPPLGIPVTSIPDNIWRIVERRTPNVVETYFRAEVIRHGRRSYSRVPVPKEGTVRHARKVKRLTKVEEHYPQLNVVIVTDISYSLPIRHPDYGASKTQTETFKRLS